MKSHTHTSFFQFRNKPGQPALLPITISAYNLDWDELLPFLKRTFPEQKFPVMVSSTRLHMPFTTYSHTDAGAATSRRPLLGLSAKDS